MLGMSKPQIAVSATIKCPQLNTQQILLSKVVAVTVTVTLQLNFIIIIY